MTKKEVLALLGISQAELSRVLGISRAAIAQWPDDGPIPEKQELRLRHELRPDAFAGAAADGFGQAPTAKPAKREAA